MTEMTVEELVQNGNIISLGSTKYKIVRDRPLKNILVLNTQNNNRSYFSIGYLTTQGAEFFTPENNPEYFL